MKKYIFAILIFLCFSLLAGNVIDHSLGYTQKDKSVWNLSKDDFTDSVIDNQSAKIESGKLSLMIKFNERPRFSFLSLSINSKKITSLLDRGQFSARDLIFIINVEKYITPGKNNISLSYSDDYGDTENMNWSFTIGHIAKDNFTDNLALTSGGGDKRNIRISPDGRFAAYVWIGLDDENAIKIIDLETKGEKVVVESKKIKKFGSKSDEDRFYSFAPCWSRDGNFIFFISTQTGKHEIYRADILFDGTPRNIIQLTNYGALTTNLALSPVDDILFFTSNKKDGKMDLYMVENIEEIKNIQEFQKNESLFVSAEKLIFSPTISFDGKSIAFCSQGKEEHTTINVIDIETKETIQEISERRKDCLYPSWSPTDNILAFYIGHSIFLRESDEDENHKIISNCKLPTYVITPVWEPGGGAIYYVGDDKNNSINKLMLDLKKMKGHKKTVLLDDKHHSGNNEVVISNDFKYLLYNSFQTGKWQIWTLHQEIVNSKTVVKLDCSPNTPIHYFDREKRAFKLLTYFPVFENKDAFLEKDNLIVGQHRFSDSLQEYTIKSEMFQENTLTLGSSKTRKYDLKNGMFSGLKPGWGQKKKNLSKKSKLFWYSTLGLATLGTGSYFVADNYYQNYVDADNLDDALEARNSYQFFSSMTSGFILTGAMYYALNIYDSITSKDKLSEELIKQHQDNFFAIKSNRPEKRNIYGKTRNDKGELKLFSFEPNVEIYLRSTVTGEEVYYGKTNYSMDKETAFTIGNLKPGNYVLIARKKHMSDYTENIRIDNFKVTYSLIKMKATQTDKIMQTLQYSVPGLTQFQRGQKYKGYVITGITGSALLGALVHSLAASSAYSDYSSGTNIEKIVEAKSDYYDNIAKRNNYFIMFGLSYLYNIYDAYYGEE